MCRLLRRYLDVSKDKYPILAKPSGIILEQHRENVVSEGVLLSQQRSFLFEKYQSLIGKDLLRRLILVCKFHDDGKEDPRWQSACQKDYKNFLKWKDDNGGTFKDYSNKNKETVGENIRKAGIRHEFQSLYLNRNKKMPLPLQAAIAAHHSKLSLRFEERWINEGMSAYWTQFKIESNKLIEQNSLELSAQKQYEFAAVRGLLQLADHRASTIEDNDFTPNYTTFNYKFPYSQKRNVQKLIEEYWQENLLLLRAPTGSGKTDASLLWASLQIQNKRADRLVIAMPTRFTSNALAINVAESMSDTGLYHSSAWFTKFQEQIEKGNLEKQNADKIHELARLLETPVTVCTIDHLLMALTLTREDHHLITFNLANSCLVIDEADFYDNFTQANILVLLEILKYWKVPILLMSASLPESVLPSYQKIGYSVNEIIEDKSDSTRDRFEIKEIRNYSEVSEVEDLLEQCIQNETAIIYVNTINKAIALYNWFNEYNQLHNTKVTPILYHSRFTEPDKKKKEQDLINALGKKAWINKKAKGIAILTQIGEMSINISADIMISEMCPIDRLVQRAGRISRFNRDKIGQLFILVPYNKGLIFPAPYGEYNSMEKSWTPCNAFRKT